MLRREGARDTCAYHKRRASRRGGGDARMVRHRAAARIKVAREK